MDTERSGAVIPIYLMDPDRAPSLSVMETREGKREFIKQVWGGPVCICSGYQSVGTVGRHMA